MLSASLNKTFLSLTLGTVPSPSYAVMPLPFGVATASVVTDPGGFVPFPGFSAKFTPSGVVVLADGTSTPPSPGFFQDQLRLLFVTILKTRFMMPLSHETPPLLCFEKGGGVAIWDDQVVHSDFELVFVEVPVEADTVADPSSSFSGSHQEEECNYPTVLTLLGTKPDSRCVRGGHTPGPDPTKDPECKLPVPFLGNGYTS